MSKPHASEHLESLKESTPATQLLCTWESLTQRIHSSDEETLLTESGPHTLLPPSCGHSLLSLPLLEPHLVGKPWLDFLAWSLLCGGKGREAGEAVWASVALFTVPTIAVKGSQGGGG